MNLLVFFLVVAFLVAIGVWAFSVLPIKDKSPSEYDAQIDEEENT